jgi:hypothetical protein
LAAEFDAEERARFQLADICLDRSARGACPCTRVHGGDERDGHEADANGTDCARCGDEYAPAAFIRALFVHAFVDPSLGSMHDLPSDETVEQSDDEDKNIAKLCITDRAFSMKRPTQVKKGP